MTSSLSRRLLAGAAAAACVMTEFTAAVAQSSTETPPRTAPAVTVGGTLGGGLPGLRSGASVAAADPDAGCVDAATPDGESEGGAVADSEAADAPMLGSERGDASVPEGDRADSAAPFESVDSGTASKAKGLDAGAVLSSAEMLRGCSSACADAPSVGSP